MKKMVCKSPFSYQLDSEGMEHNNGVIVTVPGQAETPSQLLQRFRAGMPLMGKEPIYENDGFEDLEDPTRNPDFDISDLPVYMQKIEERKAALKLAESQRVILDELPEDSGALQKGPKLDDGAKSGDNSTQSQNE